MNEYRYIKYKYKNQTGGGILDLFFPKQNPCQACYEPKCQQEVNTFHKSATVQPPPRYGKPLPAPPVPLREPIVAPPPVPPREQIVAAPPVPPPVPLREPIVAPPPVPPRETVRTLPPPPPMPPLTQTPAPPSRSVLLEQIQQGTQLKPAQRPVTTLPQTPQTDLAATLAAAMDKRRAVIAPEGEGDDDGNGEWAGGGYHRKYKYICYKK